MFLNMVLGRAFPAGSCILANAPVLDWLACGLLALGTALIAAGIYYLEQIPATSLQRMFLGRR